MNERKNPLDVKEAAREVGSAVERATYLIRNVMGYRHALAGVAVEGGRTNLYFKLTHLEGVLADLDQNLRELKERL